MIFKKKHYKRYADTVNVLVNAFNEDTLTFRDDCGCAVGHIVAKAIGEKVVRVGDECSWIYQRPLWSEVFLCGMDLAPIDSVVGAADQIKATGYTIDELKKIEWAFESSLEGKHEWNCMTYENRSHILFAGLLKTLEVVREINNIPIAYHDNISNNLIDDYVELSIKEAIKTVVINNEDKLQEEAEILFERLKHI